MSTVSRSQVNRVSGTREWAPGYANFLSGCRHDCKYCYGKADAIRFGRKTADNWREEVIREHDLKKNFRKRSGRTMGPSSHDIHPDHLEESIRFLRNILSPGNEVLIVSKPHLECVERMCREFEHCRSQILFRFTMGSSNSYTLSFWEPGATNTMKSSVPRMLIMNAV
jgi:DNA repair photolyase